MPLAPESTIADSDDLRARRLATLRAHRAAVRLGGLVGPKGRSEMVGREGTIFGVGLRLGAERAR